MQSGAGASVSGGDSMHARGRRDSCWRVASMHSLLSSGTRPGGSGAPQVWRLGARQHAGVRIGVQNARGVPGARTIHLPKQLRLQGCDIGVLAETTCKYGSLQKRMGQDMRKRSVIKLQVQRSIYTRRRQAKRRCSCLTGLHAQQQLKKHSATSLACALENLMLLRRPGGAKGKSTVAYSACRGRGHKAPVFPDRANSSNGASEPMVSPDPQ